MAPKKKAGRPREVNLETFKKICTMLIDGKSVSAIACKLGVTRQTIYNWRNSDPKFEALYEEALKIRADDLTFETLEIADDRSNDMITDPETGRIIFNNAAIQRDKLRITARTRLLQWLNPQKYAPNQKIDVTTNGKDFYAGIVIEPPEDEEDDE